ncbi:MAG: T9SS type A sorting domain-containing protein [Bacteroidales bacterium]|nr:T9SS type A sorting domain-containing protein [Bacteroidales bacterium]MCF8338721.1 T9SS type A sorting domain-containing protein [Bacteroidales bacterium]
MRPKNLFGLVLALVLIACQATAQTREDWHPITPPDSPQAREGHSMVTLPDGDVLLFGGRSANMDLFNDLHEFDGNGWNPMQPDNDPPPARCDHQAWVQGQDMYISGGQGVDEVLSDTWRYNTEQNEWHQVTHSGPTPPARYDHTVTPLSNGKSLIFGGTNEQGYKMNDLWRRNADGSYTDRPDCTVAYSGHVAHIIGDVMFVLGHPGFLARYFIQEEKWSVISGGPPVGSGSSSTIAQNAQGESIILVFGGKDAEGQQTDQVYEYNTATGELTQREALPHTWTNGAGSKYDAGGARSDNFRVILFGGRVNGEISNATLVSTSDLIGVDDPAQPPAYSLRLTPNPASGGLRLTADALVTGVRIYDMEGRLLVSREYHSREVTLDLSTLETGVYIIRTTAGEAVVTRKLMVKK